jgi:PilZ domain
MDESSRSARQHPRVEVGFPVVLVCSHMGKFRVEQATARDLSPGGMGIHTDARLRSEQPVSVEFTLPLNSIPLKVEAHIRHHIDGRYGLEFMYLTHEQAQLLQRMVN